MKTKLLHQYNLQQVCQNFIHEKNYFDFLIEKICNILNY